MNKLLTQRGGDARYKSIKKASDSYDGSVNDRKRMKAARLFEIIDLLGQGYTEPEIRIKLGMGAGRFQNYRIKINKLVNIQQARKVEELMFLTERRHNHIYREAIQAFERSKTNSKGNPCPGNPLFLSIANESIRDIRKMLGLDRTTDIVNNGQMAVFQWDSLHNQNNSLPTAQVPGSNDRVLEAPRIDPIEEKLRTLEQQTEELKRIQREEGIEEISVYEPVRVTEVQTPSSFSQGVSPEPVRKVVLKRKVEAPKPEPVSVFAGCTED